MKIKKILVGFVALFLMFGTVTPAFAMIHPADSSIFTTDANPSELQRVAFLVEYSGDSGYYREVEGYLVPEGTKLTMDNEVFLSGSYHEASYWDYAGAYVFGEPEVAYSGFGADKYSEAEGSNTITIDSRYNMYEVIANKEGKTEWMYFASNTINSRCYRVLEEGEIVDSRK